VNLSQVCSLERPLLVLRAQTAADLMTPNPVSLCEKATIREAATFLTERGISAAPVINEAGAPIGVLSQTDLVIHDREKITCLRNRQGPGEDFWEFAEGPGESRGVWLGSVADAPSIEPMDETTLVRDVMTPTVFTVRLEAPSAQVVEDMLALRVHRLFVVDDGGVLVGVVTATDVLRCLEPEPDADA
jgi:CBS domain-containing protein